MSIRLDDFSSACCCNVAQTNCLPVCLHINTSLPTHRILCDQYNRLTNMPSCILDHKTCGQKGNGQTGRLCLGKAVQAREKEG